MDTRKRFTEIGRLGRGIILDSLAVSRNCYPIDESELNIFSAVGGESQARFHFTEPVLAGNLQGSAHLKIDGNDGVIPCNTGSLVLLPRQQPFTIEAVGASPDQPVEYLTLTFARQQIQEIHQRLDPPKGQKGLGAKPPQGPYHMFGDEDMGYALQRLQWLYGQQSTAMNMFASFTLKELLTRLLMTEARSLLVADLNNNSVQQRIQEVIAFIRLHLREAIAVEDLAAIACMSKPHFYRSFKKITGLTPTEHINKERIALAKDILGRNNGSVSQACYESGFNNLNYFIKVFKRSEQVTPSQYRKLLFSDFSKRAPRFL